MLPHFLLPLAWTIFQLPRLAHQYLHLLSATDKGLLSAALRLIEVHSVGCLKVWFFFEATMSNVLSGAYQLAAVMLSLGVCMLGHASADQENAWRGLGMEIPCLYWQCWGFHVSIKPWDGLYATK